MSGRAAQTANVSAAGRAGRISALDTLDIGPQSGEPDVKGLVAAVDVVQTAHLGRALGHETGADVFGHFTFVFSEEQAHKKSLAESS